MWQLAQTFLQPMMAAVKLLILMGLICLVVVIAMARSATGPTALAPSVLSAAGPPPAPVHRRLP